jgi:hypothetical protein
MQQNETKVSVVERLRKDVTEAPKEGLSTIEAAGHPTNERLASETHKSNVSEGGLTRDIDDRGRIGSANAHPQDAAAKFRLLGRRAEWKNAREMRNNMQGNVGPSRSEPHVNVSEDPAVDHGDIEEPETLAAAASSISYDVPPGAYRCNQHGQLDDVAELEEDDTELLPTLEKDDTELMPAPAQNDFALTDVVATVVNDEDDAREIVTAEAVDPESFFQNKRRARSLIAVMLCLLVVLAVSLGIALQYLKSGDPPALENTASTVFETATQPIDGDVDSDFGSSVSICGDGSRVAIASPGTGNVQVFELDGVGGRIQLGQNITHVPSSARSKFIRTSVVVVLSNDCKNLAVGLPFQNSSAEMSGQVELYKFDASSSSWEPLGDPNTITGEAQGHYAGASVSLSADGGMVAIGSPGNDWNGVNSGRFRVFILNGANWEQLGSGVNGTSECVAFGGSVSLSSQDNVHAVAVGSTSTSGTNAAVAQVLDFRAGNWYLRGSRIFPKFETLEVGIESSYMVQMSADGNKLVISNYFMNQEGFAVVGEKEGLYLAVFEVGPDGGWSQVGKNLHQNVTGATAGYVISLSEDGSRIGMGDPGSGQTGGLAGHAQVYDFIDGRWCLIGPNIYGEAPGDYAGFAVSLSGDGSRIVVGAPKSRAMGYEHGRVWIIDINAEGVQPTWCII